jgi:hypothetical protein
MALAALLVFGSASVALAHGDNRTNHPGSIVRARPHRPSSNVATGQRNMP